MRGRSSGNRMKRTRAFHLENDLFVAAWAFVLIGPRLKNLMFGRVMICIMTNDWIPAFDLPCRHSILRGKARHSARSRQ